MPKYVSSDRSQPYLLPPDMRDWVPEDDLVHFVLEAVERVSMSRFRVNERGTGSAQYHPRMMLALLVYCYANGIFGSRRIERATYRDIDVRYVASKCQSLARSSDGPRGRWVSRASTARRMNSSQYVPASVRHQRGASCFFQYTTRSLIASTTARADWAEPSCQPDRADV